MGHYPVTVNQSSSASSVNTGGSTRGSTPAHSPAPAPGTYRDFNARNYTATVTRSGGNTIIDHGRTGYSPADPSPGYNGTYPRRG